MRAGAGTTKGLFGDARTAGDRERCGVADGGASEILTAQLYLKRRTAVLSFFLVTWYGPSAAGLALKNY